jgi:hypothetical protein
MRSANPTKLQLGVKGSLLGKTYRVAGRVVMGMDDAGQTYYWNEFNLLSDDGDCATLVFEETERGGQWRLFTYFEPQFPITAEDAKTKRVGDALNLDGTDVRVTLVDESRVYSIEGEAPEGVEVGDVARYFNAEAGNVMIVVSWTGDEVECYHGEDLSTLVVTSAFGLPRESASPLPAFLGGSEAAASTGSLGLIKVVLAVLAVVIGVVAFNLARPKAATLKRIAAPKSRLLVGTAGSLDGRRFGVQFHAVVEVAQVGLSSECHEYELLDGQEEKALLVCGFTPGKVDWVLFTPTFVSDALTPQSAAAMQTGRTVTIGGQSAVIRSLFQSTTVWAEPATIAPQQQGRVLYGFSAQADSTLFLVRWNDTGLTAFRGRPVSEKELKAAFGS